MGAGRAVQRFKWARFEEDIVGHGDSDWAGDRATGKSTSGGAIMWSGHVLKTWSTTQQTIALSSGEAELYALTRVATQCVGVMSLLRDYNIDVKSEVMSDSTAAIGIVSRTGLGRTRHIRVQYLWLQQEQERGYLKISKVGTKENIADLMTKLMISLSHE